MNRTAAFRRAGVSLMEVLISIFVILFGLLGVAHLLPVGRFEVAQTLRDDQVGACGRAALREIQVRGLLRAYVPASDNPNVAVPMLYSADATVRGTLANLTDPYKAILPAYCLDPLGVVNYQGSVSHFPWNKGLPGTTRMYRVTPRQWTLARAPTVAESASNNTTWYTGMPFALADRLFIWRDDLFFDVPDDKTARPRQLFRLSDGDAGSDPATVGVGTGRFALAAENEGNYSWMATVTPATTESGDVRLAKKTFSVSIVVFHKREFDANTSDTRNELATGVLFSSPVLLGGGDIVVTGAVAEDVQVGQWILLCGQAPAMVGTYKWYRVIAVGDYDVASGQRLVSLVGPDWDGMLNPQATTLAALIPGVVGVYTETIELEQ